MKLAKSKFPLSILVLFTFLSLLLFWPIFFGKVNLNGNLLVSFYAPWGENLPYKPTGWDQLRIYFPFYKFTLDQLKNFSVPLWNPYAFSGHPHMADFQSAVFYPLTIFGLLLGQVEFWHLLRISPMILAAFFTFLYLKNLKISKIASIFGAITFGFSPFILTWGEEVVMSPHSIVYLPLILLSIDRFCETKNKKSLLLIALSTAASFLGGYMQTSIYLLIFAFAYLVFRLVTTGGVISAKSWKLALAFIFGVLIAAVQLVPSGELYFNSARSSVTLRETLFQFLLPLRSLLTILAPDFFGHPATGNFFRGGSAQYYEGIVFVGIAALIFANLAIFMKAKDRLVMFLAIFGLVAASTTFDLSSSRLFLSLPIPFLSTSIANRVLFIPAFCLATLAAFGFNWYLTTKDKKVLTIIAFLGVLYAAIIGYLIGAKYLNWPYFTDLTSDSLAAALVSLRNLAIPFGIFLVTSLLIVIGTVRSNLKVYVSIGIVVLAFVHIFYFSQKYFSFSDRSNIFPVNPILNFLQQNQGYFRSWGVGNAFLENNFATQYAIFWPEGYDSLNNRSYGEFTYAMQGGEVENFIFRADAGLGRDQTEELLGNEGRRKLIDMVGVKYVIARNEDEEILERNGFKKVFETSFAKATDGKNGFAVFENLQVMPRAFLASNYEGPPIVDSTDKTSEQIKKERRKLIPQKLLSETFNFRDSIILEEPSPISAQFGKGTAEIASYRPQEVIIRTKSDQPKLLFLSDNYYPGWKAEVDGDETKIWRANYTFRAVPLTGGEHLVRFYYDSEVFKIGLLTSIVSLGAFAFLTLGRNRLLG